MFQTSAMSKQAIFNVSREGQPLLYLCQYIKLPVVLLKRMLGAMLPPSCADLELDIE